MLYIMSKMVKIGQNSRSQQHQRDNTGSCASLPVQTGNDCMWCIKLTSLTAWTETFNDDVCVGYCSAKISETPHQDNSVVLLRNHTGYDDLDQLSRSQERLGGHSVFSVLNVSWLSECLVFSISFGNNLLLSLRVCSVSNVAWQRYL